ncbi:MAG: glycosyltransferase family 2 protein, partial [Pseudomonadota bacterium]
MGVLGTYRLRLRRKRYIARAIRKRRELRNVVNRTSDIKPGQILLFSTQRNEKIRLPYFLKYYRDLGVDHFIIVDNDSDDGSIPYLAAQPDVSLWHTTASYKRARFGVDWLNYLQWKYAHGHWSLVVDPDEFLVYPFSD